MDPNFAFNYIFPGFEFYCTNQYCQMPWPNANREKLALPEPPNPSKKYQRTWKKDQVEKVFSLTNKYCSQHNKTIEGLKLKDFEIISKNTTQTPEQIMMKVNEISKSGTLRPGIWSDTEDETDKKKEREKSKDKAKEEKRRKTSK